MIDAYPLEDVRPKAELALQLFNLKIFANVAEFESVAGAAKDLNKAPSAVSRSIIELEKALGVQLFERTVRGIRLNDYGRLVFDRTKRIEAELGQAAVDLSRLKARKSTSSPSAITHLLFNGRKLQMLIHLVESRKISTTAEQLNITQSGASMSLSRIEGMLGASLFQRNTQGMVPTEAASRLAVRAKRVLAELRHMGSELASVSGDLQGTVVVGTLPLGRTYVFPMAVATMLARHPEIRIRAVEAPFEQLMSGLRDGGVDAVVGVMREGSESGMSVEPLFRDRLTAVARADHPMIQAPSLRLADVMGAQWILPWHSSPSRQLFDDAFESADLRPPIASVESADLAVIRQLLTASDALALVSARQMMIELQSGLLKELPLGLPEMSRQVSLITRDGSMLPPAARAVLDALRLQGAFEEG